MHSIYIDKRKSILYLIAFLLITITLLIPTMFASATSIGTNVSVTGTFTVDGNTTIGNATGDTLTITARLAADLDPNANNTINLGAFGLAYNDIFASGTLFLGSVTSTMINPWANNTSDLGNYGNAWKDIYASGTLYVANVTSTGAISAAPDTDTLFKFGRTRIGLGGAPDFMVLSHYDNANITDYAFFQNAAGATAVNSKSGQLTGFQNNGSSIFIMSDTRFYANTSNGPSLQEEASSATNPTLLPDRSDADTGIGGTGDGISIITNGVERMNFGSGGAITLNSRLSAGTVTSTMIEPVANNTSQFGSYGKAWTDIYASGTLYIATVTTTGGINAAPDTNTSFIFGRARLSGISDVAYLSHFDTANANDYAIMQDADGQTTINSKSGGEGEEIHFGFNNVTKLVLKGSTDNEFYSETSGEVKLGATGNRWGAAYLGTVTSTMIEPWANNTSDLGSYGKAWGSVYTSTTLYLGTNTATSTVISSINGSGVRGQGSCLELTNTEGAAVRCYVDASNNFSCEAASSC